MKTLASQLALTGLLAAPVAAEPAIYRVLPEESRFTVYVGKAGLFSVFGHDHLIEVRDFEGTVRWDANAPATSGFVLEVEADSLAVADEDVSDADRAQIEADMKAQALSVTNHPAIVFESEEVELLRSDGGTYSMKVNGSLELRGVRELLEVPLTLTVSDSRLTVAGEVKLRGKTWGVPQITAAGGAVKTKDELELTFEIVAVSE